ncbi:MAG: hypothetical protein A4E20_01280 [Nitrospira sp. SG-bin2]|uniref:hypothetical protein n=1 Tax=Nitrospira cf. moscoviensis SBR1015 TaxID=96242 RepID=UPI000A0AA4D7|nr:hypothetical protein [Nitrospira cf. moscoviensis SBR1015]OQW34836.1 MAG: hypothetical protein A4E20_01280 [Nitrospira sp. SG-bin2]
MIQDLVVMDNEAQQRVRAQQREVEVQALTHQRIRLEQAKAHLRQAFAELRKLQADIASGNFNHYAMEGMTRTYR